MLWIFLAIHLVLSLGVERISVVVYRRIRAVSGTSFLGWYMAHGASAGYLAGGLYLWIGLFRQAPQALLEAYFLPGLSPGYPMCAGFGLVGGLCVGGIVGGLVGIGRTLWLLVRDR